MIEKTLNAKISEALIALRPNAEFALIGDDYANLQWFEKNQEAPSWAEVEAEINNPTVKPEPTVADKLALVGLNLTDLKTALGL